MTVSRESGTETFLPHSLVLGNSFLIAWLIWRMSTILLKGRNVLFPRMWNIVTSINYVFRYADIIRKQYVNCSHRAVVHGINNGDQISGVPFTISTPTTNFVHVSSSTHVEELAEAPESKLSLNALAEDLLQPKYTMQGFEVLEDSITGTSLQERVLRTILTSKLPNLHRGLQQRISKVFTEEVYSGTRTLDGWSELPTFSMAKNVVRTTTSYAFFGEELSNDPVFLDAALQYPEAVAKAGEALRYVPEILATTVVSWITHNDRASNTLYEYLTPMVEDRLGKAAIRNSCVSKPDDCIQWIIDSSPRKDPWPTSKLIQIALSLWWASIHQVSMTLTNALYDLCEHPEYLDSLRDEFKHIAMKGIPEDLPLMDSFLKESTRLHAADTVSMRRKALSAYTFKDGLHIHAGDWVCAPSRALALDPAHYLNPMEFDGYRFIEKRATKDRWEHTTSVSRYTDTEPSFLFWGLGRRACPGRFYASHILKLILGHITMRYDIKLADGTATRNYAWRATLVPYEHIKLLVRDHEEQHE